MKDISYMHGKLKNGRVVFRAWGGFLNAGGPMTLGAGPPVKAWKECTRKLFEMQGLTEKNYKEMWHELKQKSKERWENGTRSP